MGSQDPASEIITPVKVDTKFTMSRAMLLTPILMSVFACCAGIPGSEKEPVELVTFHIDDHETLATLTYSNGNSLEVAVMRSLLEDNPFDDCIFNELNPLLVELLFIGCPDEKERSLILRSKNHGSFIGSVNRDGSVIASTWTPPKDDYSSDEDYLNNRAPVLEEMSKGDVRIETWRTHGGPRE